MEHDEVPVEEQAEAAEEFVAGLVAAIGLEGEIESSVDDDTIELRVEGARARACSSARRARRCRRSRS